MKDLIIYGSGSLGRMIEQIVHDINMEKKQWNLLGFIDDDEDKHDHFVADYPVIGGINVLNRYSNVFLVIGFSVSLHRRNAFARLLKNGFISYATLVHPLSFVSKRVDIGAGSIVYPGVHIDVDVKIGHHCIFNKLCTVGHDSFFGDFVTAAPAVNFGGNNRIGEGCEFGISSSSIQGISVGRLSIIGAGAVVTTCIPEHVTAVGVPARTIKHLGIDREYLQIL